MINLQAENAFGLSARDIGRLLRDLEVSYRPVELRAYLEQAKVERRSARIQDVKWQRPGADTVWFEIHVNPLIDAQNGLLGVSIVFFDVTATRSLPKNPAAELVIADSAAAGSRHHEARRALESLAAELQVSDRVRGID